ncbi:DNA cytosine methyltransferase [Enterococcus sp. 5H]|uniref:DNA cytosine methyltransferase n=1 Tax=Enterococcus sp. 5H TaxID=1229490 RepID=UPI003FA5927E
MEQAGHKCLGFCEIDKFARQSYKAIHETTGEVEMHDITTVTDEFINGIGSVDVLCGGFPCQAFSIAGKRRGFEDTRGTLFFEIARFARILKPKYLLLENVKGLLSHEKGATFETILRTLDELGYDCSWQLFNSKVYVPQNRERVYIIGCLRGSDTRTVFPLAGENSATNCQSSQIKLAGTTHKRNDLSRNHRERTYYTNGLMGTLTATDYKSPKQIVVGNVNPSNRGMNGTVFHSDGLSPTITTNKGEGSKIAIPILTPDRLHKRQNGRRFKTDGEDMFTVTAQDRHGIIVSGQLPGKYRQRGCVVSPEGISPTLLTMQGGGLEPKIAIKKDHTARTEELRIRKLTPLECWRLQAFPDWAFLAAKFGSKKIALDILEKGLDHYDCMYEQKQSNSQLYKQAGNSVTVAVVYEIAKRL